MTNSKTKLAVLISGDGSSLQAILDGIRLKVLDAEIVVAVSSQANTNSLERAAKNRIPTEVHLLKPYMSDSAGLDSAGENERGRKAYDTDLVALVKGYEPVYVVLAGWMHTLSMAFLREFPYRVVSLHPALPGKFPGAHAIRDAFEAYQRGEIKETGVMVHLVPDAQVSAGPILGDQSVPIYPSDTMEMLENRIYQAGDTLLVKTLDRLIHGD